MKLHKSIANSLYTIEELVSYVQRMAPSVSIYTEGDDYAVFAFDNGSTIVQEWHGLLRFMGRCGDLSAGEVVELFDDILDEEDGLIKAMLEMAC